MGIIYFPLFWVWVTVVYNLFLLITKTDNQTYDQDQEFFGPFVFTKREKALNHILLPFSLFCVLLLFGKFRCTITRSIITVWEVSLFGVFLVRIFTLSDWIRRDSEYGHFSRSVCFWKNLLFYFIRTRFCHFKVMQKLVHAKVYLRNFVNYSILSLKKKKFVITVSFGWCATWFILLLVFNF